MPNELKFEHELFEGRPFDDEIEDCTFTDCDLEEVDFCDLRIADTVFTRCDLRMVKFDNTRLQGVQFVECRLVGVAFSSCNDFALDISMKDCDASFTSYAALKLSGMSFFGTVLNGADFSEADLSKANLQDTDLINATFDRTNLKSADLRGATGFDIDPDTNQIQGATFSRLTLAGLLRKHGLKIVD